MRVRLVTTYKIIIHVFLCENILYLTVSQYTYSKKYNQIIIANSNIKYL